jgi:sulfur-oxidizing protein SoxX
MMTVQELINLVAFLQLKYKLKPITYTHYGRPVFVYGFHR